MKKENVAYTYHGILFSLKKGNSVILNSLDDSGEQMLSDINQMQDKYLNDFTYIKHLQW
jgi:hypothetical protein